MPGTFISMTRSVMGLLAEIPVLQEGERGNQRRLDDGLLIERHEGALLYAVDVGDDLPPRFVR